MRRNILTALAFFAAAGCWLWIPSTFVDPIFRWAYGHMTIRWFEVVLCGFGGVLFSAIAISEYRTAQLKRQKEQGTEQE